MAMRAAIPYYTVDDLERFPNDGNRYELVDGVLLVTPAPNQQHQLMIVQLVTVLSAALRTDARVVGPGVVLRAPGTQLEPDVLVYPARWGRKAEWSDVTEHWLAVEIFSPSSKIYDRDFKRDEYFRIGLSEVWLIDPIAEEIEVCTPAGSHVATEYIFWTPPSIETPVEVDVRALFAD